MAVQPIDVIGTAVKISLGGIIEGIFAYLMGRFEQKGRRNYEIQ